MGIMAGMTINAFDTLYPAWYLEWGARVQLVLMAAVVFTISRRRSAETLQAAVACIMFFFVPLPLYFMLAAAEVGGDTTAGLAASGRLAYVQIAGTLVALLGSLLVKRISR